MHQGEQAQNRFFIGKEGKGLIWIPAALPWCVLLFILGVSFSIAAAHIALGLWALLWLIALGTRQTVWRGTPLDGAVIVFLTVDLFTGLFGVDPARSLRQFVSLWHVAIYLLVVNTIVDRRWLERTLAVLLIAVGVNAGYGISQHFWPGLYFFMDIVETDRWIGSVSRELGTFSHSMTFAGQMVLAGLFGVALFFWWRRFWDETWWSFPVIAILTALVLSYTRSAWLGGLAGLVVLGLMRGKEAMIGIGISLGVVLLIMSGLEPAFSQRVKSISDPNFSSNRDRINMAKVTYEMFKDNPILGVGSGNYGRASEVYRQKYGLETKSHPHNNLLAQLAQKGLLGLGAFIYIWYLFFKEAWIAWRNSETDLLKAIAAGGFAALIGFHIAGMFEANFGDSEVAMMMWLLVGLVMLVQRRDGGEPKIASAL